MFASRFPFESIFWNTQLRYIQNTLKLAENHWIYCKKWWQKSICLQIRRTLYINTFGQVGGNILVRASRFRHGRSQGYTAAAHHYQSKRCYTVAMGEKQRSDTDKAVRKRPCWLTLNFFAAAERCEHYWGTVNSVRLRDAILLLAVLFLMLFLIWTILCQFFGITLSFRKVFSLLFEH